MTVKWVWAGWLLFGAMAWAQTPSPDAAAGTVPGAAQVPDWIITSSPARLVIKEEATSAPAPLSAVRLCLPAAKWLNLPIRVFADNGTPVGCDLLWSAPGEPATLVFDSSSGAKVYKIYFGSNWPAIHLNNPRSGVIVEGRAGDGRPINDLGDLLQEWNQSTTVYGRLLADSIYAGGSPFGAQDEGVEHFQGWFDVPAQEHLLVGSVAIYPTYVLIDGKQVVGWRAQNTLPPEKYAWTGQFDGGVDLAPGTHSIECYVSYTHYSSNPLRFGIGVRTSPQQPWSELNPGNTFLRPVTWAQVTGYELQSKVAGSTTGGGAPPCAVDWSVVRQDVISPANNDLGLILMQLNCRTQLMGTVTWTFDDGTTAQGNTVQHLFPRPGMRTVQVSITDGANNLGGVSQQINVRPSPGLLNGYPPTLFPEDLANVMSRDPSTMSASDLAGCVAVLANFQSTNALLKIIPALIGKLASVDVADLPAIESAAAYMTREDPPHDAEAMQLLQAVANRCPTDHAATAKIGSQSRLILAQVTLKTTEQTDPVKALIAAINPQVLSGDERRDFALLQADLALANGDVEGARKQYEGMAAAPTGADLRSSIRLTAKIALARAFLDQRDDDSAEGALMDVVTQSPVERMSPDWALTQLRYYQENGQPVAAYIMAKRLLAAITDSGRSELLFRLADLGFTQGHDDVAKKALSELLQSYPYSEESAKAKEKWPGKV